jgi:hypothetical protein
MDASRKTLILCDGGLTSLLAAAVAREWLSVPPKKGTKARGSAVLMPRAHLPASRQRAVELQAELYGHELIAARIETIGGETSAGEMRTRELLSAGYTAARLGCDVVVWPVQCVEHGEPNLDKIAKAADRAVLVSRLVALDADEHGSAGLMIETPYLDFTDEQIADLAADMNVPTKLCWWNQVGAGDGEAAAERERWEAAFGQVGWRDGVSARAVR